jgi:chromosomal replication initiation ATPase DnaA
LVCIFTGNLDIAISCITGFSRDELLIETRVKDIREARQIAMAFYILNGSSERFAAIRFGRKHPTALQSLQKLRGWYNQKHETELRFKINALCKLTGLKWN